MSLSLRDRQRLYDHLARLINAGVALPKGIDKLAQAARGSTRALLRRLAKELERGSTAAEAFAALPGEIGLLEQTTIASCERTGRLEWGCRQLAEYFASMESARREVLRKSLYPLCVLHLAVFLLNLPLVFTAGMPAYLERTGFIVITLWGTLVVLALLVPILRDAGAVNPAIDRLLNTIPGVGGIRRSLATSRFVGVYELQLNAGVNVLDALQVAGRASRSGALRTAAAQSLNGLRRGEQVGALLAASGALPSHVMESWLVGEATGELDQVLPALAAEERSAGLSRLAQMAEWLPRMLYIGVVGFVGYTLVRTYQDYLGSISRLIDAE